MLAMHLFLDINLDSEAHDDSRDFSFAPRPSFFAAMLLLMMTGCEAANTQEMEQEFAKVQRTLNERVDQLEKELDQVRIQAQEALENYQITTNELVNQVKKCQRKLHDVTAELENMSPMEETWSIDERASEEPRLALTMAAMPEEDDAVSFDSIFDEVETPEDDDLKDETDEKKQDCPLLVTNIRFLGTKRLEGRRESKYWVKTVQFDLENPTDHLVAAQIWAHPPPAMGWYFDDFGPKQVRMKSGQKKNNIIIPYEPGYKLFLLIDKVIYSFPLEQESTK